MNDAVRTLLDRLTADAQAWNRIEAQMRQDAARGVAAVAHVADFDARILKSALVHVRLWNARAEYYGDGDPAETLERELTAFVAGLDRRAKQSKSARGAPKRRGPRAVPPEIKALERTAVAQVQRLYRNMAVPIPVSRVAREVRRYFETAGLRRARERKTAPN